LHEIEIVNEVNGKPRLLLSGKTAETLESLEIRSIHVSLSHLKTYASAIVILES